jgi:hypothetical protein
MDKDKEELKDTDDNVLTSKRKFVPIHNLTKMGSINNDSELRIRELRDLEDEEENYDLGEPNPADIFLKHLMNKDYEAMHNVLEEFKAELEYDDRVVFAHLLLIFKAEKEINNTLFLNQFQKRKVEREMR